MGCIRLTRFHMCHYSFSRHMLSNKIAARVIRKSCSSILWCRIAIETEKLITTRIVAFFFVWRETDLFSSHSRKLAPTQRLFSSIWWKRVELFAKSARDKMRNGVVGRIGNTTPIAAIATNSQPKIIRTILTTLSFICIGYCLLFHQPSNYHLNAQTASLSWIPISWKYPPAFRDAFN